MISNSAAYVMYMYMLYVYFVCAIYIKESIIMISINTIKDTKGNEKKRTSKGNYKDHK